MLTFDSWVQILRWMPMIDFSLKQELERLFVATCMLLLHTLLCVCSLYIVSSRSPVNI